MILRPALYACLPLFLPALAASADTEPTGLMPMMTQQQYDDAMWCIGRFDSGQDAYAALRPLAKSADFAEALDDMIERGKPLKAQFASITAVADDPSQKLDKDLAAKSYKEGRALIDAAKAGSPNEYWDVASRNAGFSEECGVALEVAIALASLHEQASAEIAEARSRP